MYLTLFVPIDTPEVLGVIKIQYLSHSKAFLNYLSLLSEKKYIYK